MYGKLTINREGKYLNQTFHGVPESVFRDADIQKNATGCVNISWVDINGNHQAYLADKVTGVAFERNYS
jgi:hypothetical protein